MIDLHTHTTASDGTLSPTQLVALAVDRGVTCLAVTDHDTVYGLAEAEKACIKHGVGWIPGIELSAVYRGRSVDILGYGIDADHPALVSALERLALRRRQRVRVIVERLNDAGVAVEWEAVKQLAPFGTIGRPHVAQALVQSGAVKNVHEAFRRFIGQDKTGFVPKEGMAPEDAIQMIRAAGGAAVLAHPRFLSMDDASLYQLVAGFAEAGLSGIEVYYGRHTAEDVRRFGALAQSLDLIATGGSDFHGEDVKPGVRLGIGAEGHPLDPRLADDLLAHLRTLDGNAEK